MPTAQVHLAARFRSGDVAPYTCPVENSMRNMTRWKSSLVDMQGRAHMTRVARPLQDPAGPAAAEPVTGTGTDAMITDATAASSSVLVTDIIECVPPALFFLFARASRRCNLGCTRYIMMPSYTLPKQFQNPAWLPRARFEMPRDSERDSAAGTGKKGKSGAMANAAKMAIKAKAGSAKNKEKGGIGKGKSKKVEKTDGSS
jgi:hypothetical protein